MNNQQDMEEQAQLSLGARLTLALAFGLFLGSFFWLWFQYGTEVFVTYTQNFLAWCL